jgi:uncharacterized protein YhaN
VERLADQRAAVVKAAEDLPKREGELAALHQQLDEHARRLGLADRAALLARRPPDAAVARARSLLGERRRLRDQRSERRATLAKVVAELDDLARKRDALGHVADPAPLRQQLDGLAGLPQRIETRDELARNLAARQADIDDRLARLVVPVASADELARLPVPDIASVELAVERFDGLEKRRGECVAERRRLAAQAAQVERRIGEYTADGEVLEPDALNGARGERDACGRPCGRGCSASPCRRHRRAMSLSMNPRSSAPTSWPTAARRKPTALRATGCSSANKARSSCNWPPSSRPSPRSRPAPAKRTRTGRPCGPRHG